jgi:hypothetical protein
MQEEGAPEAKEPEAIALLVEAVLAVVQVLPMEPVEVGAQPVAAALFERPRAGEEEVPLAKH